MSWTNEEWCRGGCSPHVLRLLRQWGWGAGCGGRWDPICDHSERRRREASGAQIQGVPAQYLQSPCSLRCSRSARDKLPLRVTDSAQSYGVLLCGPLGRRWQLRTVLPLVTCLPTVHTETSGRLVFSLRSRTAHLHRLNFSKRRGSQKNVGDWKSETGSTRRSVEATVPWTSCAHGDVRRHQWQDWQACWDQWAYPELAHSSVPPWGRPEKCSAAWNPPIQWDDLNPHTHTQKTLTFVQKLWCVRGRH